MTHNNQTRGTTDNVLTRAHLYRPDIDGLRAVSVLAVIIYHFFPAALPGGLVGVDIFFVISGYLINKILIDQDRIDAAAIRTFYARRIKRIFPALLTVMCCTFAFGWIALYADEFKELGKHIMAGAGFASNLVYMNEAGYFDASAEQKPLLHLWSLAVEEQFYLIWPLLLIAVTNAQARARMVMLLWAASFSGNLYLSYRNPDLAYYLPLTRFWEILSGALLAFIEHDARTENSSASGRGPDSSARPGAYTQPVLAILTANPSRRQTALAAGLLLIVLSLFTVDGHANFPGWQAFFPIAGACLVILAGSPLATTHKVHPPTPLHTLLANRWMIGIGLISYPLYLWHWPIISYLKITELQPGVLVRNAGIAATFILAALTYFILEKQVRHRQGVTVAVMAVLMILMAAIGHNIWRRNGLDFRQVNYVLYKRDIINTVNGWLGRETQTSPAHNARLPLDRERFIQLYPDYEKHLRALALKLQADPVLYKQVREDFEAINQKGFDCTGGDCPNKVDAPPTTKKKPRVVIVGDSHAENFFAALDATHGHYRFVRFTQPGCVPIQARFKSAENRCSVLFAKAQAWLKDNPTDLVLLVGRWPDDFQALAADMALYQTLAKSIAVVGPSLHYSVDVSKLLLRYSPGNDLIAHIDRHLEPEKFAQNDALRQFVASHGVTYIDKINALCGDGLCRLTEDGNQLFIIDYGHLSRAGARYLGLRLLESNTLGQLTQSDRLLSPSGK